MAYFIITRVGGYVRGTSYPLSLEGKSRAKEKSHDIPNINLRPNNNAYFFRLLIDSERSRLTEL